MAKIAKIDVNDYFKTGDPSVLKSQSMSNELLLRLTVIVNSMADQINEGDWDRLHGIMKRTEERVAKLEGITSGYVERGPGG